MSARYVFVGERPSPKAARIGATWQNGRMAARTLHAALEEIGERPGLGPTRERLAPGVLAVVLEEMERGAVVVALGRLVERELQRRAIPHRPMVHPAARGKIRKRERYVEHVRTVLLGEQ
jgi:plasmid stabilization system protein ParE